MKQVVLIVLVFTSLMVHANPNEYIRRKSEELQAGMQVMVGEELIYCQKLLPEFYHRREFELAWSIRDRNDLLETLAGAEEEGLIPEDYHYEAIRNFRTRQSTPLEKAELDMLLTDAFLLYASHFLNGKVNPETVDSEWKAIRREGNAREFLEIALAEGHIKNDLQALEPKHRGYAALRTALKDYKAVRDRGGWQAIPTGETLKPGMTDSVRVPLLISRLLLSNDLQKKPADTYQYTEIISESVKRYQERNGLEADGNLGKLTTAALNVSVDDRISQIMVNMERIRWISQELGTHYVLVNIADYKLQVFNNGRLTYQEKVIVGKPFRKTPVFSSKMTYMVVNPTWTVPPTILFNDILPEVIKDPGYLANRNIRVLQGQGSQVKELDPYTIDWSKLSKNNFPYTLRQDPGPTNALGAVKFMFPNPYNVYIHDTPSKELFARQDRAFSSGCIRINKAMSFAQYLLQDYPSYSQDMLNEVVRKGVEHSIILENPLNVHILYLTAWAEEGIVQFRNDLYQRDQPVLDALLSRPPSI